MYSIEVNKLKKRFGKFTAVDNISFNVNKGEIFGFLGANGAGKSTTIKMLCGIFTPTGGDAIVGGFSVMKHPDKVKKSIGYMSQKFSLYNDLTVEENIDFFSGVYGLRGNDFFERKEWALQTSNLKGKEKILTSELPGGIKQRLALATAVIHRPQIVFLDEPTSGVDPISRRNFWDLINELSSRGTTVLVTTHYLEEAEYCNNIILIDAGKIIADGSSKLLKEKYIKNPILEIECERSVDALEVLEKELFVDDLSIFGNNIHLSVNDNYNGEEDILAVLADRHKIMVSKVTRITPTLEDVFITLLEKNKDNAIKN